MGGGAVGEERRVGGNPEHVTGGCFSLSGSLTGSDELKLGAHPSGMFTEDSHPDFRWGVGVRGENAQFCALRALPSEETQWRSL